MATGAAHNASRPEYMNATPHHSKVRVSLALSSPLFVAGQDVTGKMEMECRSDKGVGIGLVMVEIFAIQELNSRDHSASSTFLHTRRLFQGPGLPPSNAVVTHPPPGQPALPQGHFPARRGVTTFFFRFPIPLSSPSSVSFASGLAKIRYEVRASVGVAHKGEKRVVTDNAEADVVQCEDMDGAVAEHVVVGENGKIYVQGRIVGGRIVSGQQACVELRVKNQSSKKTTGLSLTLTRTLHLHDGATASRTPLQLSDTLSTQNFRGAEYCVQAGADGVANLVFDVPKAARAVKGGVRDGADDDDGGGRRRTQPLFEVQCILGVKIGMGIGSKDVVFEMPVQLSHPATLPDPSPPPSTDPYPIQPDAFYGAQSPRAMSPVFEPPNPYFARSPGPGSSGTSSPSYPYASPSIPSASPLPHAYYHPVSPAPPYAYPASPHPHQHQHPHPHQHMWSPPLPTMSPLPYFTPDPHQAYYFPPPPVPLVPFAHPARPSSAGGGAASMSMHNIPSPATGLPSGLPGVDTVGPVYPAYQQQHHHQINDAPPDHDLHTHSHVRSHPSTEVPKDAEEGKGERASRIAQHLRTSTRARSVSPMSHRFPAPAAQPAAPTPSTQVLRTIATIAGPPLLSPRPVLSPRNSFSDDIAPGAGMGVSPPDAGGTARSGRVDLLERMVDPAPGEEGKSVEEVLRDLERAEKAAQKTLPGPPVPSGKMARRASGVPKASDVFGLQAVKERDDATSGGEGAAAARPVKSVLRPSPMARRISADGSKDNEKERASERGKDKDAGAGVSAGLLKPELVQRSSGLDALEKRLLYEVGTRKPDKPERSTVFALGNAVPATTSAATRAAANDSEISSLALASNGSTELLARTRANSNTNSNTARNGKTREERVLRAVAGEPDKDRVPVRHKDRGREEKAREHEALKLRKAAKGRVADWLGDVAATDEPENDVKRDESDSRSVGKIGDSESTQQDAGPLARKASADGVRAVSPSRTSNPKPIDAPPKPDKPKALQSPVLAAPSPLSPELKSPRVRDRPGSLDFKQFSKPTADASRSSPPTALPKPPVLVSPRLHKPTSPANGDPPDNKWPPPASAIAPELDKPAARAFKYPPPQLAPETKYDVRSARGGKGGITTSVAAIWSSLADEGGKEKPSTPPSNSASPAKRPAFLDVGKAKASPVSTKSPLSPSPATTTESTPSPTKQTRQPRNPVKSASVPASVVSSHARPHLSSTASLARPALAPARSKPPSLSPTLNSSPSENPTPKTQPVASEMAFGQARLKDLIKKYQQAAS